MNNLDPTFFDGPRYPKTSSDTTQSSQDNFDLRPRLKEYNLGDIAKQPLADLPTSSSNQLNIDPRMKRVLEGATTNYEATTGKYATTGQPKTGGKMRRTRRRKSRRTRKSRRSRR